MEAQLKKIAGRAFDSIKDELVGVALFVGLVWAGYILDIFLPLERLALVPRKLFGVPGIICMHFLHKDLGHILSNTFPLFVLLTLMAGSRANTRQIVLGIMAGSGLLLWLFGAGNAMYIGASALVFGLIGFLVTAGFLEKRPIPLLIAIGVGFMYGWTFLIGLLPLSKQVSEWSHFLGALTGVALAFVTVRGGDLKSLVLEEEPAQT